MGIERYTLGVLILLTLSCGNTTMPESESRKSIPKSDELTLVIHHLAEIGKDNTNQTKKSHTKEIEGNTDYCHYKVKRSFEGETVGAVGVDFHFSNDSICQQTFGEIKNYFNQRYHPSKGSEIFSSWEAPSKRNFVINVLLSNKSTFYSQPTLEIILTENDRVYRK